ncbi:MAG: hypothetical protein EAZ42_02155 [Verrucomicrobia bacterium]|nr:MAG: hypothetical protein EAZ42_02155 [Verrucomicrobiota bacterium]
MKIKLLILPLSMMMASSSFAATSIFGSYINVTSTNFNSGAAVWYDAQIPGGSRASDPADFNAFNFGVYNPSAGGALDLTGGEVLTSKGGPPDDITGATISYRVYPVGPPSGSFTAIAIAFTANATFADAASTAYSTPGDQKWSNGVGTTNLLTGLSNGDYQVEVFLQAASNTGTIFSNNGGGNFIASFRVIPEPSSALLGLLGGLALLRRNRR